MSDASAVNAPSTEPLDETKSGQLPLMLRICWGLGSMPLTILNMMVNVLLLRFMTDSLGIAAGVASLIFATAKIWDAISDPLMGMISDRISTPWGRRLPWLLLGGLLSGLAVIALFCAPTLSPTAMLIYLIVGKLVYATAYTMYMVPYMTMPTEMTSDYHERTQLMSFRVIFSSIGTMVGLSLAPALLAYWGADRQGHMAVALLVSVIAMTAVIGCVLLLRRVPSPEFNGRQSFPSVAEQFKTALENRPFLWLMCSKLIYFFVLTLSISTLAFFTRHVLQVSDAIMGLLMGVQSVALIFSQPIWLKIARHLGKREGYMIAAALYGLVHLSWWFAEAGEPNSLIIARAIIMGIAGGGTFLLSQAMLPDALEYDRLNSGIKREGSFTGFYVLIEKVAGALGVAFVGLILSLFHYQQSTDGREVTQPESAQFALYLCIAILPAILQLISIFAISRYRLTESMLIALRESNRRAN